MQFLENLNFIRKNNLPNVLNLRTYDGSGQTVHPSVIDIGQKWNGYRYWMVITPYPNSNNQLENPSIFASNDGYNWVVPDGLENPIEDTPTNSSDFLSDAEIIYNSATDELWCYWRETLRSKEPTETRWYRKISSDGINWSEKEVILENLDETNNLLSMSLIIENGDYKAWTVNSRVEPFEIEIRTSSDGVNWGSATTCSVSNMPSDRENWHIDIYKYQDTYYLLNCMSTGGGGSNARLGFGNSEDGVQFTMQDGLLPQRLNFENSLQYRASMYQKADDSFSLYYSGRDNNGKWKTSLLTVIIQNNEIKLPSYDVVNWQ